MTKLMCFLVLLGTFPVTAAVDAQTPANLNVKNAKLRDVIWELQRQTGFVFVYSTQDVEHVTVERVQEKQKSVKELLDLCLENSGLV
ncbi:MAG: hypothetical protein K2O69_07265, partial [Odoribacter sp.]|nr:hypothetical protein [Odoribacter sp.]